MNRQHTEESVSQEIWDKVGEQLEMLPHDRWNENLVPLLMDLLAREKNYNEYLKIRLQKSIEVQNANYRPCAG